jgi:hypothetical protein
MNTRQLLLHGVHLIRLQRQNQCSSWEGRSGTINLFYVRKRWAIMNPFRNYVSKIAVWTGLFIESYLIAIAEYVRLSSNKKHTLESNSCIPNRNKVY